MIDTITGREPIFDFLEDYDYESLIRQAARNREYWRATRELGPVQVLPPSEKRMYP